MSKQWFNYLWPILLDIIMSIDDACKKDRKSLLQFIESYIWLNPCDDCWDIIQLYIRKNPLPFKGIEMIDWYAGLHNYIYSTEFTNEEVLEMTLIEE